MISNKAVDISQFEIEKQYTLKNGVFDLSIEDYHSGVGISRSSIMEFNKTPFHYWNKHINPNTIKVDQKSKSLNIGNLLHTYVMERDKFNAKYLLVEKMDGRTDEAKKYYAEVNKVLNGRTMIKKDEFAEIQMMSDSLLSNKKILDLIIGGQYEKSLYWNDPHTGLLCKVRPDIWHKGFICDLKTCVNARLREFQQSLYKYGYHIQCAMMQQAFEHVFNIQMRDFIFIVIENTYPYANAIYKLDELALEQSVEIFKNKLLDINQCYQNNDWPSYKTQIITLPNYAIGD